MERVLPFVVQQAAATAAGNPAILSARAPWGFVPVGLDYFTHPHLDPDDATLTTVFLAIWKAATGRTVSVAVGAGMLLYVGSDCVVACWAAVSMAPVVTFWARAPPLRAQCVDFDCEEERRRHVSRNIFTFGGLSAFLRNSDCDLLVFDARRVVHGADLRVPLGAEVDDAGAPCGVTIGSGVVSRELDIAAGQAEARGRVEAAAATFGGPRGGANAHGLGRLRAIGKAFEEEVTVAADAVLPRPPVILKRTALDDAPARPGLRRRAAGGGKGNV